MADEEPTTKKSKKARKSYDHLKERANIIDRYGLGADLVREVLQGGSSQSWQDIKRKLEDKVLEKSGMVIEIPLSVLVYYFQKVKEKGFDSLTLAEYRREIADSWIRNLNFLQDQFADMRVMMEKAFQERDIQDYSTIATALNNATKLMAEIHRSLNINQIVRDKIVAQINQLFLLVKEYPFPELVENFNGHSVKVNDGGPSRSRISDRKLNEIRGNLIRYLIEKMPQVSKMFKDQQNAQQAEQRAGFIAAPLADPKEDADMKWSAMGEEEDEPHG